MENWESMAQDAPESALENAQEERSYEPAGESAAEETAQQEQQAQETAPQEEAQDDAQPGDAADTLQSSIERDVLQLMEDGWTAEQLRAFAADENAQRDIAAGKTARQAATAYLMRRSRTAAPRSARHGVPALRTASSADVPRTHAIDRMSSSEFAAFSDGLYERLLAGERISL